MAENPFFQGVGGVLSADIAVPNHEAQINFYTSVLSVGNEPLWKQDLMNNFGVPIIGVGARSTEYEHLPLQWMPHIQVADVARSVENAIAIGGKELMHSKNEAGESQWAVIADPGGAAFGLIPVVQGGYDNVVADKTCGRISRLSLHTKKATVDADFYQSVVGWDRRMLSDVGDSGSVFQMGCGDQRQIAQIHQKCDSQNELPGAWLIYLSVANLDESLERVEQNGGQVIQELSEANSAVIKDPIDVFFGLCVY